MAVGAEGTLGTDREGGLRLVRARGGDGDGAGDRGRMRVAVDAEGTLGLDRGVWAGSDPRPRAGFGAMEAGRNDLVF